MSERFTSDSRMTMQGGVLASGLQQKQIDQETANRNAKILDEDLKKINLKPEGLSTLTTSETGVIDYLIKASGDTHGFDKEVKIKMQKDLKDGDKNPESFYSSSNKDNKKNKVPYNKIRENAWPDQKEEIPGGEKQQGETSETGGEEEEGGPPDENPSDEETPGQGKKNQTAEPDQSDQKDKTKTVKDSGEGGTKKTGGPGKKPPTIKGNEAAFKKMGLETGMKTAGGAVSGATGTALKAAARPIAAAIITAGWPVIVVVLIIVFIIGIWLAVYFLNTGKRGSFTVNAASDYTQIQANLAASKIEILKKALDENIDEFIKQIEMIKSGAAGRKKEKEIKEKCDKIIELAKELKAQPEINMDNNSAGGPTAGKKETLKADIMDKVKELVPLIVSSVPCLYEPAPKYCGQTSAMMVVCTFNPNCGIKQNSTVQDYSDHGSKSYKSGLQNILSGNLPEKKIIEVNTAKGISNPDYGPLMEQAKIGNPVVIGSQFPGDTGPHYMVVVGYNAQKNVWLVNNPNYNACTPQQELPFDYFKTHPYPGGDYWYMYIDPNS